MKGTGVKASKWKLQDAGFRLKHQYRDEELKRAGIYAIVNVINGHVYIGQSVDMLSRRRSHFRLLRQGKHTNAYLQNAFDYYGECNMKFTVAEFVDDLSTLNDREQYWIEKTNSVYNISKNVFENCRARTGDIPDGYFATDGESFVRPIWHTWVYGGAENPLKHKRATQE